MLTKLTIRNFKRFSEVEIDLGRAVVFIGPNNSGKTTALQALALWECGLQKWVEKRKIGETPDKRPGVTINRRDLISIPVPTSNLLWKDLHVRSSTLKDVDGKKTNNIRIDIIAEGDYQGKSWTCGLEFDYANEESFYCRPLRVIQNGKEIRMPVPEEATHTKVAFLPPMSGLAAAEPKWEYGRINVLLGEGQTAQVLRNLCYTVHEDKVSWDNLTDNIKDLFGISILPPEYIKERGEIQMQYKETNGVVLDLSASGRGLQQTLLLLSYLYANPSTVLLLDEPDAHLEILRQRQIYQVITRIASEQGAQIIAASHSEIVLNEAAEKDVVVAFVGKPHRIDDRGSQVLKSLKDIGFDQYYQAEQTGWVLYLEGATDLAILQAFAKTLGHPAKDILECPFVKYVGNNIGEVNRHFHGLKEACQGLAGIAIFDRTDKDLRSTSELDLLQWNKREIENYLCMEEVLLAFSSYLLKDDLFGQAEAKKQQSAMEEAIKKVMDALEVTGRPSPWSSDIKATDDFLDPLFLNYFKILGRENVLKKSSYSLLASLVPKEKIDQEIIEKLDAIVNCSKRATLKNS